ncbi:basic amino acid/polyamine antiporter [Pantoea ananatis]|uniref:basic amino acid/polyamine antiporter n=1 Tax=Pantoea ananas TaxID=553 RepID=UPI003FA48983
MTVNKKKKSPDKKQIGVLAMTLLVISAMFGGGVYNIPQSMAQSAGLGAILIAWIITSLGVFFIARTFQMLADFHPEMKSGIYMYSRAGFGKLSGFLIAWGYWMSAAFGNVGYAVLLMDALNYFFPPYFKGGNTWQAVTVASVIIWSLSILVMRGVNRISVLNIIGTIAKFIPITLFIIVLAVGSIYYQHFGTDFWGQLRNNALHDIPLGNLFEQVKSTMLVTLWMYIGIESAVVMSDKTDGRTVSRATILGFVISTVLFVLVSVLPFGVFSQGELAAMSPPSTAAILSALVGEWGSVFINLGIIIALLSSWMVWTLLVAELPWACAKDGTFPKFFSKLNNNGVASNALWVSTIVMQAAMILVFFSTNAWKVMLSITGVVILPAYIGSSAFLCKLSFKKEVNGSTTYTFCNAIITGVLATLYGIWLIYAAGISYILLGCVIYSIGLIVYIWARKEQVISENLFTNKEKVIVVVLLIAALVSLYMLFTGQMPSIYN